MPNAIPKVRRAIYRDQDKLQVAQWLLEGASQYEIADRLGCSRGTVQEMVNSIRERWAEVRTEYYHGHVINELDKLQRLEDEALEAWEESKTVATAIDQDGNSAIVNVPGDIRYLEAVLRIMDSRAKRLRLYDFDPRRAKGSNKDAASAVLELAEGQDYAASVSAIAEAINRARDAGNAVTASAKDSQRVTRGGEDSYEHSHTAQSGLPGALRAV